MSRIILEGGLLVAAQGAPRPGTIVLEDGSIAEILEPGAPAVGERVDCQGLLLTPGLIDAHTHLLSSGAVDDYEHELLHASLPLRTLRGAAHVRAALDHGFTTMRDVCTEGAEYADVALRDAIRAGLIEGPRVVPSGPGLGITGGYLPEGYAPHVCAPHGCTIVDGPDAARREVRVQVSHGAEWIKVFADWPAAVPPNGVRTALPTFTDAELEAIVDEARRRGRRVAAHATSDAGAAQAVRCGVASIEHLGPLSAATLDLLAERGVFLVPTFSVLAYFIDGAATEARRGRMQRALDDAGEALGRAMSAGVRIVCGTDIGCFPHAVGGRRELALLTHYGMSPRAALWAATGEAGALIGVEGLGTLAVGAPADLCGFVLPEAGEPIEAVWSGGVPGIVVAAGKIVRDVRGASAVVSALSALLCCCVALVLSSAALAQDADEPTSASANPKNPHTTTISGNQITATFNPADSAFASDCTEILHVQALRMNADDTMILPGTLQSNKKWLDATASDNGWVIDSVVTVGAPFYQGWDATGAGSTSPAKSAVLEDGPVISRSPDLPPYDPTEAPNGWKAMFWQFKSYAVCAEGPQCGTWYEGLSWNYTQTAEETRAGKAGTVSVFIPYHPPAPATSEVRQAYERYVKAKGYVGCK